MRKYLVSIICLFCVASANVFATTPLTIRFATEATYPPYVYVDNTGQIVGFGPSLARALCAELKATCSIANQPWDSLIPSLKLEKFNALIGGMQITKERLQQVAFTKPYLTSTASLVTPVNAPLSLTMKSMKGKTIGVLGATTQDNYLLAKFGNAISINRYISVTLALLDLRIGRIDGVLGDTPVVTRWIKLYGKNQFAISATSDDPTYFGYGIAIAVRKNDTSLLNALNAGLTTLKKNGTIKKLKQEYFAK